MKKKRASFMIMWRRTFFAPESHAKDCSAACVFALSKPGALHSPPR